jgi:septum formation protein
LLDRLGLAFESVSPSIDETPWKGEEPAELVTRLALDKARSVARERPDQVATLGNDILGKPGTTEDAVAMLTRCSGRSVEFLTGVCVLDGRTSNAEPAMHVDITRVAFRPLNRKEIVRYVDRERPLDCAGGFRSEGLGIALFDRIDSQDPTGLIGLPLIWLAKILVKLGFEVL